MPSTQPPVSRPKIIVFDDDPTGSQTVHSCLLLLRWDVETLVQGLLDDSPIVFVLTNTRSRSPEEAAATTRQVCRHLKQALVQTGIQHYLLVSRSDSTLRGHYPLETDVIAEELGPFDAHFLVPAFFEGGRQTLDGTHFVVNSQGDRTPVHQTEFARDPLFGFQHSYLPDYVEEKNQGKISADQVKCLTLSQIRAGVLEPLRSLQHNRCVVVDAEQQSDCDRFAQDLLTATSEGKRFLLRSAASLLTSLAQLPPQPIPAQHFGQLVRPTPTGHKAGAIIVGSHTTAASQQLQHLLQQPDVSGLELDVTQLLHLPPPEQSAWITALGDRAQQLHQQGQTLALYTSRQLVTLPTPTQQRQISQHISHRIHQLIQHLPPSLSFLISKGGITSNLILSNALQLPSVRLLGQILPGVCLVQTPAHHPKFPNLPVVLFPGNVGSTDALTQCKAILQS